MKKQYLLLIMTCLLIASTAFGQQLDAPSRKADEPAWGIGVQIPLLKLFGKKKVKALPEPFTNNKRIIQPNLNDESTGADKVSQTKQEIVNENEEAFNPEPEEDLVDSTALVVSDPVMSNDENGGKQCYATVLKRRHSDGSETWTLLGVWCMGNEVSDGPADDYGDGGSGSDPIVIVEEIETNDCEDGYITSHPWIAPLMFLNREQNNHWCETNYPRAAREGESSENAMRHALFQAQNFCTIGESATREMATRHEVCDGQLMGVNSEAVAMDMANNEAGINIGRQLQALGLCDNFLAMTTYVQEAYFSGTLWRIGSDGQTLTPTP